MHTAEIQGWLEKASCFHPCGDEKKHESKNQDRVLKKKRSVCFSTTSLPFLYKQWNTLHKIYYIQAEILSSADAIHHPSHETL